MVGTTKLHFTKKNLEKAAAAESLRLLQDTKNPNLFLHIYSSGKKTFTFQKFKKNRTFRARIGEFPLISVEDARMKAIILATDLEYGRWKEAEKEEKKGKKPTINNLYVEYYLPFLKTRLKSTVKIDQRYRKHLKKEFGSLTPEEVRTIDIFMLHRKLTEDNGKAIANKIIEFFKSFLDYCDGLGHRHQVNFAMIKKNSLPSRERVLTEEELESFFEALDSLKQQDCSDFFRLLFYTGVRKHNLVHSYWKDIDLINRTWVIPAEEAKMGKPMHICLASPAVEILQRRRNNDKSCQERVFPIFENKKKIFAYQFDKASKMAGITDFVTHDLRRTHATRLLQSGMTLPEIGRQLGHRSIASTQIYARIGLPDAKDVQKIDDAIRNI